MTYAQFVIGIARLNGIVNADDKIDWKKGNPELSPLPEQVCQFLD